MSANALDLLLVQKDNTWELEEWIVPLSTALQNVTTEQALWTPPGGGNTIWQTVNHINFYNKLVLSRLKDTPPSVSAQTNDETFQVAYDAEDVEAWNATLAETKRIALELRETIAALSESDLEAPYRSSGPETIGHALSCWMLHDAYHSGQIVLIRKMQGSWRS
ncbi:DinB family protein [Paenibacillus puldeungensis]|uniref:DinB family protein n=1 Tax=Paenibacillus puldeungensis TaxID=696536 RepID=A0ABW3RV89_9BACL